MKKQNEAAQGVQRKSTFAEVLKLIYDMVPEIEEMNPNVHNRTVGTVITDINDMMFRSIAVQGIMPDDGRTTLVILATRIFIALVDDEMDHFAENISIAKTRAEKRVFTERQYQDQKWGGLDDINDYGDFFTYIRRYIRKAEEVSNPGQPEVAMKYMMKVCAIAFAALEKFGVED